MMGSRHSCCQPPEPCWLAAPSLARHCGQYRVELVDTHGLLRATVPALRRGSPLPKSSGGYRAAERFMHKAATSAWLSLVVRANCAAVSGSRYSIALAGT